jgi:hypothetical protein
MFVKSTLVAGLFAALMAILPAAPAEARTSVTIGIGTAGWGAPCWNRAHRCGHRPAAVVRQAYVGPRHVAPRAVVRRAYVGPRYVAPRAGYYVGYRAPAATIYYGYRAPVARVSCSHARAVVARNGYTRVVANRCGGQYYSFKAWRGGRNYVVTFNAHTGRIVRSGRY